MKKPVALIFSENQANSLIRNNIENVYIFPMTPDIYNLFKNNYTKQLINPFVLDYDLINKNIVKELLNIENDITNYIKINNNIHDYNKESILNIFHVFASASLFLWFMINEYDSFYIHNNGQWFISNSKHQVYLNLNKYIYNHLLDGMEIKDYRHNYLIKILTKFINYISIINLQNKNIIITTGRFYGIENIIRKIKSIDNNIIAYHLHPYKNNIVRVFLNYINNFKLSFEKTISIYYNNDLYRDRKHELIFINKLNSGPIKIIADELIKFLTICINKSDASYNDIYSIVNKTKPKFIIAHQQRWLESIVLCSIATKMDVPVYLISHGSHTINNNKYIKIVNKYLARGMLYSPFSKYIVPQSPNANSLIQIKNNNNILKSMPIMWGNARTINFNNNSDIKYILHAGTAKLFSARAWIYENYFEYLNGINILIKSVTKMKNVRLIVRLKPISGCNMKTMQTYLSKSNNVILKQIDGNFNEDLSKSTLLVSYCSTTIEEALYAKKPVAIMGGTERYKHLRGSSLLPNKKKRHSVYYINKQNIDAMLESILDCHDKIPLTKNELEGYIWQNNENQFYHSVTKYLNENNT